jgi:MFS family permease
VTSGASGTSDISAAERRSARHGWRVVAGAFAVMFVSFGVVYSFSAFFASLQEAFAAPRGAISLIFSITAALYCIVGIVSGPLADRFGPRPIALIGVLMSGAGLFVAARAEALWQVYVGFGIGLGFGVGFAYVPAVASIQRWFFRRRGTAAGIAVAGVGLGTLCMPLLALPLISWVGWRGAWVIFGLLVIGIGGIASLLLDVGPEHYGLLPDGGVADRTTALNTSPATGWTTKHAVRSKPFRLLYLSLIFVSIGTFIPFVHLVPYAEDHQVSHGVAVAIFSMLGIGSTVGRFAFGGLADRVGRQRSLAAVLLGLGIMQLWWFGATTAWQLVVFALVFGSFYGGFNSLYPALTVDYFGGRNAGAIIGVLYSAAAVGIFAGPRLAGDSFDVFQSYTLPILISAGCAFIGAALVLWSHDPTADSAPDEAPDHGDPSYQLMAPPRTGWRPRLWKA